LLILIIYRQFATQPEISIDHRLNTVLEQVVFAAVLVARQNMKFIDSCINKAGFCMGKARGEVGIAFS